MTMLKRIVSSVPSRDTARSNNKTSQPEPDSATVDQRDTAVIVRSPVHISVIRRHRRNLITELRDNLAMVITALAIFYLISNLTSSYNENKKDDFYESQEKMNNS